MGIKAFFKKAFADMKESTKAQHEVDKAEFRAAKAEAKANFEENRAHNTFNDHASFLWLCERCSLCGRRCFVRLRTWRNQ